MTNAELLAKIKAEIERRKMESIGFRNNEKREDWASFFNGEATALENLLSFLSDLESEKPSEGLEDILLEFYDEYDSNVGNRPIIPRIYAEKLARHFAEWGAEHLADARKTLEIKPGDEVAINGHKIVYDKDKGHVTIVKSEESVPKDLEEAANNYLDGVYGKMPHSDLHIAIFIAGAEWNREKMMKEAVEGEVVKDISNKLAVTAKINLDGFKFGDKVRVIVLPKED